MELRLDLSRVAAFLRQCQDAAGQAWTASVAADSARAEEAASKAQEAADRALGVLARLGVEMGADEADAPGASLSLSELAALERVRDEAQSLAAGLRALLPLAERIDAARGRSLPEPVAGSAGLDLAEDLVQLLSRVELDLYGPGAALTGARE